MHKKRILFFINTLSCGGAEKVLIDLVNCIHNSFDVTLVSILGGDLECKLSKDVNHIKIIKSKSKILCRIFSKVIFKLPYSLFNFLFLRQSYDLEVAYLGGFCTRVIAKRKNNAKKIAFVHTDVSVSNKYNQLYKNDEDFASEYRLFSSVCFVSDVAKDGFEKTYGKLDNAHIIHNVINIDDIMLQAQIENNYEYTTNGLKIISVGRLSFEKGFDRLIRIAKNLEKEFEFELWILGEGPERQKLEALIESEKVKSVKLLGYQNNPYSFLKKADLYVCSSLFEGYSTSVTEAAILGIPVLTTDCAGMNEILNNDINGIVVDNNELALKDKLKELLYNNALYDAIKFGAYEYSCNFSNDYAVKEYNDLFSRCLKQ